MCGNSQKSTHPARNPADPDEGVEELFQAERGEYKRYACRKENDGCADLPHGASIAYDAPLVLSFMTMKKVLFVFGVLPLLFLVACVPSQPEQDEMMDDEMMMEEEEKMVEDGMMMDEEGMMEEEQAGSPRVIRVTAENWMFTPAAITVKKGERVQISLEGLTGLHGYSVPDLGINQVVEAGQTVTFDLPTDEPGIYNVRCSVPCGEGHRDMTGQIIIEE